MIVSRIGAGETKPSIRHDLARASIRIGERSRHGPKLHILHPNDPNQASPRHLDQVRSIIIPAERRRSGHRQILNRNIPRQSGRLAQRIIGGFGCTRIADCISTHHHRLARPNVLVIEVGRHRPTQHQGFSAHQTTQRRRSRPGGGPASVINLICNGQSRDGQRRRRDTCRRKGGLSRKRVIDGLRSAQNHS